MIMIFNRNKKIKIKEVNNIPKDSKVVFSENPHVKNVKIIKDNRKKGKE